MKRKIYYTETIINNYSIEIDFKKEDQFEDIFDEIDFGIIDYSVDNSANMLDIIKKYGASGKIISETSPLLEIELKK